MKQSRLLGFLIVFLLFFSCCTKKEGVVALDNFKEIKINTTIGGSQLQEVHDRNNITITLKNYSRINFSTTIDYHVVLENKGSNEKVIRAIDKDTFDSIFKKIYNINIEQIALQSHESDAVDTGFLTVEIKIFGLAATYSKRIVMNPNHARGKEANQLYSIIREIKEITNYDEYHREVTAGTRYYRH